MAKLRHIAFIVKEPRRLCDFYHSLFGFEQVRLSPSGSIHVIDGLFNLAFLQQSHSTAEVVNTHRADGHEVDQTQGINHYGFLVDNLERTLSKFDDSIQRGESPQNGRPAEVRFVDPWGNKVDLSSRGFLGREEKKLPGVRHVAIQTDTPDSAADFYRSVLEMREIRRGADGTVFLSDGEISLTLTKHQSIDKKGIQYFGIQVENWSTVVARFIETGMEFVFPRDTEHEVRLTDPEGNLFVVSARGWEV